MAAYTWTTFPASGSSNFETTARAVLEQWRVNVDDMESKLGSIADGTIDAANITVGSGKTLNVSAGTLTLADDQISGDKVEGGTISSITISKLLASASTELTIATGSITPTQTFHLVDTESNAATDDLTTIAAGSTNQFLIIRAAHADRTVVVKHGTGNILTGGQDISLADTDKFLMLAYDTDLSKWVIVGGAGGGGLAYVAISTDTTAEVGKGYLINATSGNVTLTLPTTAIEGNTIGVVDAYDKATTNTITIARNGHNIEGQAEDIVFDINGSGFTLVYMDVTRGWEIVSEIGVIGTAGTMINQDSDDVSITGGVISGTDVDMSAGTLTLADDQILPTKISTYSGKNAIINGGFNIWQRGTSFTAVESGDYVVDRIQYSKLGDMVHTVSQDTDVPTQAESGHKSNYSLKVDCTTADSSIAAGDYARLIHKLEGYNFAPFVGKTATLSFWVKATKAGVYCVAFRNAGADRSYITEYTINTTNTWEKKTITLTFNYSGGTWNYTTGIGGVIAWTLAAGSTYQTTKDTWQNGTYFITANQVNACDSTDNNFWLAQVQFELGSVATDFEYEDIGTTLRKCQRYYQKSYNQDIYPGAVSLEGCVVLFASDIATIPGLRWPIEMRTIPTVVIYSTLGTSGKVSVYSSGNDTGTIVTATYVGEKGCLNISDSGSGLTAGVAYRINFTASAEL